MYGYHVTAIFPTYDAAERAKSKLRGAGVGEGNIHLSHDSPYERQPQGFWDWLFGTESPRRDREWYRKNLTGGRTAVSVLIPDDHDHIWIAEQLVAAGALDLEDEQDRSVTAAKLKSRQGGAQGEEVIPVTREELEVGKRTTENRYRVRAHVVERPVEQDIRLRDERYTVERRPASGQRGGSGDFQDREYEVVERHEEPVVQKRARADEEVVIRKEAQERTQRVGGKVRETRVEVDRGDENRAGRR